MTFPPSPQAIRMIMNADELLTAYRGMLTALILPSHVDQELAINYAKEVLAKIEQPTPPPGPPGACI